MWRVPRAIITCFPFSLPQGDPCEVCPTIPEGLVDAIGLPGKPGPKGEPGAPGKAGIAVSLNQPLPLPVKDPAGHFGGQGEAVYGAPHIWAMRGEQRGRKEGEGVGGGKGL